MERNVTSIKVHHAADHRSTQDPALWRLCERSRIMSNIVVALFVVALLSFLLVSVA